MSELSTVYLREVGNGMLDTINVTFKNRLPIGNTSKGSQLKWFKMVNLLN